MKFRHESFKDLPKPWAVDPPNCGCTECLVGDYKPLNKLNSADHLRILAGDIENHTNLFDAELDELARNMLGLPKVRDEELPLASVSCKASNVRELWEFLGSILPKHGDTPIGLVDPCGNLGMSGISAATLWDTTSEIDKGNWGTAIVLILHSGHAYPLHNCQKQTLLEGNQ